jgi:hypothetical protein
MCVCVGPGKKRLEIKSRDERTCICLLSIQNDILPIHKSHRISFAHLKISTSTENTLTLEHLSYKILSSNGEIFTPPTHSVSCK